MKVYNAKLQQMFTYNKQKINKRPNSILQDIPNPEKVLSVDPIAAEDLNLVSK